MGAVCSSSVVEVKAKENLAYKTKQISRSNCERSPLYGRARPAPGCRGTEEAVIINVVTGDFAQRAGFGVMIVLKERDIKKARGTFN